MVLIHLFFDHLRLGRTSMWRVLFVGWGLRGYGGTGSCLVAPSGLELMIFSLSPLGVGLIVWCHRCGSPNNRGISLSTTGHDLHRVFLYLAFSFYHDALPWNTFIFMEIAPLLVFCLLVGLFMILCAGTLQGQRGRILWSWSDSQLWTTDLDAEQ